ncbi:hypothetical protein JT358_05780 [Micrococcales bacterium 31B]|nr:hypothetical protein [Micrococcales bacterium 31B]
MHDIQGHTLHALKLSLRVARKPIPSDPQAAAARLEEAEHLVEQALRETRSLATGEREMNIGFELANAEQLSRAAGIEWQCAGEAADASDELLAILRREATTNLLRHATATHVEVTLAPGLVSMRNDGAKPFKGMRGLANLSNRFSARGGTLSAQCTDGWFTVTGRLP